MALLLSGLSFAQAPRPTTLLIEVENWVEYLGDSDEVMKHGTAQTPTTSRFPNVLFPGNLIGDILLVARAIGATPTITPGR